MRTRTRLSTPPGQEPEPEAGPDRDERYLPGFALPREPRVPRPGARLARFVLAIVAVLAVAALAVRIVGATEDRDPALPQRGSGMSASQIVPA